MHERGGGIRGSGGRVGSGRGQGEEGLAVVRGALDKVPLFWRYANVARCDITEDVE